MITNCLLCVKMKYLSLGGSQVHVNQHYHIIIIMTGGTGLHICAQGFSALQSLHVLEDKSAVHVCCFTH